MPSSVLLGLVTAGLSLPAAATPPHVPGEVLARPRLDRQAAAQATLAASGLEVAERDSRSGVLRILVPHGTESQWVAHLSLDGDFVYAELNGIGQGGFVPGDTFFGDQWHLRNVGQSGGTPGADIEATLAWDITTGSASVGVAVLDSGIQTNHPDFAGRIASNGWNFVAETSNPQDDHGHGTWVTGALAANGDNGFAVAGVDWHCTIIPIKVLNQFNGGTTFDLAQGLNYAAEQPNVDIVSMSLINYPGNATLLDALQTARDSGKILIACGGNGGPGNADVSFPGASPLTICIGWTTRTDARASSSGTGMALDFVAPGQSIATTAFGSTANLKATVSGCSFATPISAGIAALLLGRAEVLGLTLDHDDIFDLFLAGAEDQVGPASEDTPGYDTFFGHGRLNALLALEALNAMANPADLNGDGVVDAADLGLLLAAWGAGSGSPADLDGNGVVDGTDLGLLLAGWNG